MFTARLGVDRHIDYASGIRPEPRDHRVYPIVSKDRESVAPPQPSSDQAGSDSGGKLLSVRKGQPFPAAGEEQAVRSRRCLSPK
jgi:hypothetical protein